MNTQTMNLYHQFRKASPFMLQGCNAQLALNAARTIQRFQDLENAGIVRLRCEFDSDVDTSWMDAQMLADWDGEAYGSIGEYRIGETWHHADSVWGHIGYSNVLDPFENPYIVDIMDSTLAAFDAH